MAPHITGACLCGQVRFTCAFPSKFFSLCHCSMCRRAHGAPVVAWAGFRTEQVTFLSGKDLLTRYSSSKTGTRSFCSRCGTTLLFEETSRWGGETHVAAANLEGEMDREIQAHCFFDDRLPWFPVDERLERLGGPDGVTPLASTQR